MSEGQREQDKGNDSACLYQGQLCTEYNRNMSSVGFFQMDFALSCSLLPNIKDENFF